MKWDSALSRDLELEPHHWLAFSVIPRTPAGGGGLTPFPSM